MSPVRFLVAPRKSRIVRDFSFALKFDTFALMNAKIITDFEALDQLIQALSPSSITVLVDSNTHEYCLPALQMQCSSLLDIEILEVPPGEESKDMEIVFPLWQSLAELQVDRKGLLVNLGGGMVTDLGGFVASTFKRGMRFIHIPTSLLGMVDAAYGGKTGINLGELKNQVGTFRAPEAIFLSPAWLESLPQRELVAGYAEMLKHALIADPTQLAQMMQLDEINAESTAPFVQASLAIKKDVVEQDPFEQGLRKALNFGHTYGHALESLSFQRNEPLLHGEAIAVGIKLALQLSVDKTGFDSALAKKVNDHIDQHFKVNGTTKAKAAWHLMQNDKKNEDGEVRFVLLKAVGEPLLNQVVHADEFYSALAKIAQS